MSDFLKQIEAVLNNETVKSSLTAGALQHVSGMVADNKRLTEENEKLRADSTNQKAELTGLKGRLDTAIGELAEYRKRETELLEREKKITTLELTAEHQKQRVNDHVAMFGQVFRNVEVRRNTMGYVPVKTTSGGYDSVSDHPTSSNETETQG